MPTAVVVFVPVSSNTGLAGRALSKTSLYGTGLRTHFKYSVLAARVSPDGNVEWRWVVW